MSKLKLILICAVIPIIDSSELQAQFILSDTLIYHKKDRHIKTIFEVYPNSTYYYYTESFPIYYSKGTIEILRDTLILSSFIENEKIGSTKSYMAIWLNFDHKKFLIKKDNLYSLPEKKKIFKLYH